MELVNRHGTTLADSVDRALTSAAPVTASLRTTYGTVDLPFADDATRARWHSQLKIDPIYLERHAAVMKHLIDRDGHLPRVQRDPVQVWHVGSPTRGKSTQVGAASADGGFTLVALGGEVVVDYAIRLARDYPQRSMWVAGYSNDVFGYVPSLRVLHEGGYEGGDAMIYYARPGPFNQQVEELIIGKAHQLMGGR